MATQSKTQVHRIDIGEVQRMKDVAFVDARSTTALSKNPWQVPHAVHVSAKASR